MKAHSGYSKRKNSKQGLALSTAMAICIVLAILVAILVSIATVNITTTQITVSQREAYIQAKSALGFAESYYAKNPDKIPSIPTSGAEDASGQALIVFNTGVVSEGAKVYTTLSADVDLVTGSTFVEDKKKEAQDAYVEVYNYGDGYELAAYAKYGTNDLYTLKKQFGGNSSSDTLFDGNIKFVATSDTRYLRIHVRANPAFEGQPYLWTYYTTYNPAGGAGGSSIVNKMSQDSNYKTITNGTWISKTKVEQSGGSLTMEDVGPTGDCAMLYEGNQWYVTEMQFGSNDNVNFVNCIVTRPSFKDKNGNWIYTVRTDGEDRQSWEMFGIPVPKETGENNGLDVYITLNSNTLQDARNVGGKDELTKHFEDSNEGKGNVNDFAKYCNKYYNIFTKKNISTIHYRRAKNIENTGGPEGFEYEGYGWYRLSSNAFDKSTGVFTGIAKVDDQHSYSFNDVATVSMNEWGREIVKEGFIADGEDSEGNRQIQMFDTEEAANKFLAEVCGDAAAGNYLTINVKSKDLPVDGQSPTKLSFKSKYSEGGTVPTPVTPTTPVTPSDPDDPTPGGTSAGNEELKFEKLANVSTEPSGIEFEYTFAVIGNNFSNWGRPEGATSGDALFSNVDSKYFLKKKKGSGTYQVEIPDCPEGHYEFKIIRQKDGEDKVAWGAYAWGDNGGSNNMVLDVAAGQTVSVWINTKGATWSVGYKAYTPGSEGDKNHYAVVADWENDFGRDTRTGVVYTTNDLAAADDMTYNAEQDRFEYVASRTVETGITYNLKIVPKATSSGAIPWDSAFGGDADDGTLGSDGNFVFTPPADVNGNPVVYSAKICFYEGSGDIKIELSQSTSTEESFYVIGDFPLSKWANNTHSYAKAAQSTFMMDSTNTPVDGNYVYTYEIPEPVDAGDYQVKVFSSKALLEGVDSNADNSIDYEQSWGEFSDGTSMGSGKASKTFKLEERSIVTVKFTYNPSNPKLSKIDVTWVKYEGSTVTNVSVGYHNKKTKLKDGTDTAYDAWDKVYVTYHTPVSDNCIEITANAGSDGYVWGSVPKDAEYIYFSNMYTIPTPTDPDYKYTVHINNAEFKDKTAPTFTPKSLQAGKTNVWEFALPEELPQTEVDKEGTYDMVWTGSNHNNYYDAPLVKVLDMLVNDGSHHVYCPKKVSNFEAPNGSGHKVTIDGSKSIAYQGEVYYYTNDTWKGEGVWSYLIVQDTTSSKGGYLLENHMGFHSDTYGGVQINMDNRAGATFTSDPEYYNGDLCPYNYGGYVPNWYTVKVPVSTKLRIEKIEGMGTTSFLSTGEDKFFEPAQAVVSEYDASTNTVSYSRSEYYKQPIYIDKDYSDSKKYFTYDTTIGSVDTDANFQVSVYFENTTGWNPDKIRVYAYNPVGESKISDPLPLDHTDAADKYFRFTFNEGQYCYFQFFEGDSLDSATHKTKVLFFDGVVEDNKYNILAQGENAISLVPYCHPKTLTAIAARQLKAAASAAGIPIKYKYSVKTGEYEADGYYEMAGISAAAKAAEESASKTSGVWDANNANMDNELAKSVKAFAQTLSQVRIYIADDVPDVDENSTEVISTDKTFRERSFRDDIVAYDPRWTSYLTNVYQQAIDVYGSTGLQNSAQLDYYTSLMKAIIESPETTLNENTVQLIVNDTVNKNTGNGGWGPENIHLYCKNNSDEWIEINYRLFETTQTNYYAYVFKLIQETDTYMVSNGLPAEDVKGKELKQSKTYQFNTSTGEFSKDLNTQTIRIIPDEIKDNDITAPYGYYTKRQGDRAFILYFDHDTKIYYGGGYQYTIYAGAYKFTQASLDLFTDTSKAYFQTPARYGMNYKHDTTPVFTAWDADIADTGENIDIMCDSITKGDMVSATTSMEGKRISFRYIAEKDNDKLTLGQNVSLEGGTITIAANAIDLGNYNFYVKAKKLVFFTDTTLYVNQGGMTTSVKVARGNYTFVPKGDPSDPGYDPDPITVNFATSGGADDWQDYFTRVDNSSSTYGRGTYAN